jgi:hypothetical protein
MDAPDGTPATAGPWDSLRFPSLPIPLLLFTSQGPAPGDKFTLLFQFFSFPLPPLSSHTAPTLGKSNPYPNPSLPCTFHLRSIKHPHAAASRTAQKKKKLQCATG